MKAAKNKSIGGRIMELRQKKKITLEELSEKTGLGVPHLESIERSEDFAPVGDILKISRALTVDPNEFLKLDHDEHTKKKKRVEDFKRREASYLYTVLTPEAGEKHLRAFHITIPPLSEHPKISYQHEGEEFIYVLGGEVEVMVGQKKHLLKKGGSLHFDSGIRHSLRNPGDFETHLIVTVYTP